MKKETFHSMTSPICLLLVAAPLALALNATALDAATPTGACVSAKIDAPFRLPDGSLHPAATLTMCEARAFSPVATIHSTYVDGRPVGMFVSRIRHGERAGSAAPSVVLQRDDEGRLDLLGYVIPAQGRDVAYQFGLPRRSSVASPALAGTVGPVALAVGAK